MPDDMSLVNPTPMDMPAPTGQPGGTCPLSGAFLNDMTIPDGASIVTGEVFEKTWQILNNGCAQWPEGTTLMHVGGLALSAPPSVPVDPVAVNAIADATVLFRAPVMPGPYRSFWQLATPEGVPFGQVYHVDIVAFSPEAEAMLDEMRDDVMEQMEQDEMAEQPTSLPPDVDPPIDDPTLMPTVTPTPEGAADAPVDDGAVADAGQGDDGGGNDDGGDGPTFSLLPTPSIQLFGFPDLVVDSVDIEPNPVGVGEAVTISVHVKNQGVVDSPPYSLYIAASGQEVTRNEEGLPAGLREREAVTLTFDTPGFLTALVIVDVNNDVVEVDENNNQWVSSFEVREDMAMTSRTRALSFSIDIFVEDHDTFTGNETERMVFEYTDVTDGVFIESKRWDVCADNEVEGTVIINYYVQDDGSLVAEVEAVLAEGPSCSWGKRGD